MALPASTALPPPNATTASHFSPIASARPSLTMSRVGSLGMAQFTVGNFRLARKASLRCADRPVTSNTRLAPSPRRAGPACAAAPAPKTMRPGAASSNAVAAIDLPDRRRCDRGVGLARARFGHHGRYGVAPGLIVRGLLVRRCALLSSVNLEQHEAPGIGALLHDVEAHDTVFSKADSHLGQAGR